MIEIMWRAYPKQTVLGRLPGLPGMTSERKRRRVASGTKNRLRQQVAGVEIDSLRRQLALFIETINAAGIERHGPPRRSSAQLDGYRAAHGVLHDHGVKRVVDVDDVRAEVGNHPMAVETEVLVKGCKRLRRVVEHSVEIEMTACGVTVGDARHVAGNLGAKMRH